MIWNHHLGILPDCSLVPLATLVKGWRCEATLTQARVWWLILFLRVDIVVPSAQSLVESLKSFRMEPVVLSSIPSVA
jgi:hypothetical protein